MSRVFVSYSHDSPEHKDRVLALAHRLLEAGHDVRFDRFTGHPSGETWPQWMCRQIREAEKVVCICTPNYRRRFEGDERVGGLGVSWEGHVLTTDLYLNRGRTSRVVPVYADSEEDVPFVLRAHSPRRLDEVVDALGGRAGPARPIPSAGEGMREVVSVGRLLDPLFKPPRKYVGVGGYLPSQLLRPEHAIVPYIGGEALQQDLLDWSKGGGARVRVVHGPGGAGKTRLALEVAGRLVQEGWRAGPLAWRHLSDEALDELFRDPIPLFLVLDYAETRPAELVQVLRRLADHPEANARVLLLARAIGDWWTRAQAGVPELEGLAFGAPPIRRDAADDGLALAQEAAAVFARWQGAAVPAIVPDRGRTALERQVEALVAVLGGDTRGLEGLLRHEDAYVQRAASSEGIPPLFARRLPAAMALLTLAGGVPLAEAGAWLLRVEGLEDLRPAERRAMVGLLQALYPKEDGGIDGLRPDRVGEALVVREDGEGRLAETAAERGRGFSALVVLARIESAGGPGRADRLIAARREALAAGTMAAFQELGISLRELSSLMAPLWRVPSNEQLAAAVQDGVDRTPEGPLQHLPRLAAISYKLALRHAFAGEWAVALEAIGRAQVAYRWLATAQPQVYSASLLRVHGLRALLLLHCGHPRESAELGAEALRVPLSGADEDAVFRALRSVIASVYLAAAASAGLTPDRALLK